ncbi:MAG TPA: tetratricopeptide repeat protein [Aggregatilineales bacterium]|nr:tetratricopeptide repeat protein [Anaerolineae bacterium]HUN10342.1 tetratricopeptide repeat protein [Aggregatilineales bacterium]
MPGDRTLYEQAMNAGHNAAWDGHWTQAITAYGQAVQQFPDDAEAHIFLGGALIEVGRLEDSLKVYTRAYQLSPNDPIPLEKSADILEKLGRLKEAAQQYVNVAELYLTQRDLEKAIFNWDRATRLTPGLVAIHAKLAQAYERLGDKARSIREYLTLAANFQQLAEHEKAARAAQRALKLDSRNAASLNALRAIETRVPVTMPNRDETPPPDKNDSKTKVTSSGKPRNILDTEDAVNPLGPMGEAMDESLSLLATYVMESGAFNAAAADALQALEFQRQELYDKAIEAYQRAAKSLDHPALRMNLGGLMVLTENVGDAVNHLQEAANEAQLVAGALHGLGICMVELGRHKSAMHYLLESMQAVDATVSDDIDMLGSGADLYEHLEKTLDGRTDEVIEGANQRFLSLLKGKEWKLRVPEMRRQMEETMRAQGDQGVVDLLVASQGDVLTEQIGRIDRYLRQGLLTLAMDEAHRAVEISPLYIPVHVRMAEIMMKEGRVRQAINKYNMIAKTYMVRQEDERAAAVLKEVLELAPLDLSVRESLIELLESQQRWDEAIEQYIDLADTHHQLGNFDMSRDVFMAAERMANRVNAPAERIARIKHRMADIDQLRLDMRKAQRTYEEIIQLVPEDERAHRVLIDLHYRQRNPVEAIKRLDGLLAIYAKNRQVNRILQLLEELVKVYPNEAGVISRLAAIYRQMNRRDDAIAQLDRLGELQLEAGLHQDATTTIRQIISLNPDGIEDYRRLLAQLGG